MKLSTFTVFTTLSSVAAFAPSAPSSRLSARSMADVPIDAIAGDEEEEDKSVPSYPTLNGWTADPNKFCLGLPGSTSPLGEFDPLGFTSDLSVSEIRRYREAEITHGRVAMMASVGYLVGENFHPLFGGQISGPANTHLGQVQEVAPVFFFGLAIAIGLAETRRALTGWEPPVKAMTTLQARGETGAFGAVLRDDYYPGDIGFDPLGLKPRDPQEFADMQNKELNNGRLAMLAAAGMIVQEQVNSETILGNLGF